jgi:RNA-directed DNA polymerase
MENEKQSVSSQQKCDWNSIDWSHVVTFVRRLRQEIFRAAKEGNLKRVRSLQHVMLRSYENRCLAVRRVTQLNKGRTTPGVDKIVVKTPEARGRLVDELAEYQLAKKCPARRIYIPKANGKLRPLGIPDITNRAVQAMVLNALEPFWEAKFEDSSYGFRPKRSCQDAIARIFKLTSQGGKLWVLDADIKGAFDNIDHDKLMQLIGNFPARELIRQWLKAGYVEFDGSYHDTHAGTPQGGVISPLLANIALHGMEEVLGVKYRKNTRKGTGKTTYELAPNSVGLVRYADDFVVLCHSKEEAEAIRAKLVVWLKERGLELSEEKTRITHLDEGFDFLGFNIRRYKTLTSKKGDKLFIKPSKKSVKAIKQKLKETFRKYDGRPLEELISRVNPIIRGWCNYFRCSVASRTFDGLDNYLVQLQYRWVRRRHANKSWGWLKRYWGNYRKGAKWVFGTSECYMMKPSWVLIKRHVVVQRFACWDDPALEQYWEERDAEKASDLLTVKKRQVAKQQNFLCPECGESLNNGEELHEHHVKPRSEGGDDSLANLRILHLYCHLAKHGKKA